MDYKHVFPPKLTKSLGVLGREDEQIPTSSTPQLCSGNPGMLPHVVVKMLQEECVFSSLEV